MQFLIFQLHHAVPQSLQKTPHAIAITITTIIAPANMYILLFVELAFLSRGTLGDDTSVLNAISEGVTTAVLGQHPLICIR